MLSQFPMQNPAMQPQGNPQIGQSLPLMMQPQQQKQYQQKAPDFRTSNFMGGLMNLGKGY